MAPPATEVSPSASRIDFACPERDIVVIKVIGRGNFQISGSLKEIPNLAEKRFPGCESDRRYIVDLDKCSTMDSTFFGVLASIGLRQMKAGQGRIVLVNTNHHILKILDTLGLSKIMETHSEDEAEEAEKALQACNFEEAPSEALDKHQRIVLMLEAHHKLIEVYEENQVRFENVLECLEESLDAEQKKKAASNGNTS